VIGEVIQTDAAIYPGSSGGPLLDLQGRLIGVNSQVAGPSEVPIGFGFALSSNTVRRVVEDILREPVEVRERVLMLTHVYPAEGYQKLQALAAAHGIDLQVFDGETRDAFLAALKRAGSGGVIYAAATVHEEELSELSCFLKRGGRALMVYNHMWQVENERLEGVFGISVAAETVKRAPHDGQIELDERTLPSSMAGLKVTAHLSGLEMSTASFEGTAVGDITMSAYLTTGVEGGERGYLASEESGQERLACLALSSMDVTFWPGVVYAGFPVGLGFYDEIIDEGDNTQAALALLQQLVGNEGAAE
jgi:hypothetical protein